MILFYFYGMKNKLMLRVKLFNNIIQNKNLFKNFENTLQNE